MNLLEAAKLMIELMHLKLTETWIWSLINENDWEQIQSTGQCCDQGFLD